MTLYFQSSISTEQMRDVFRTTTPIRFSDSSGWATGFFYLHESGDYDYLITNRHALYELDYSINEMQQSILSKEIRQLLPDDITIRIREKNHPEQTDTHTIQLFDEGSPIWKEHSNPEVDLVAIPLDIDIYAETGCERIGNGKFTKSFNQGHAPRTSWNLSGAASASSSAVVAGYPISKTDAYTPILRNALVSSPLDPAVGNDLYFLLDADLHDGMSGSPVFVRFGDAELNFIGVHSGPYDTIQEGGMDLNRVWYRDLIDETIEAATPE